MRHTNLHCYSRRPGDVGRAIISRQSYIWSPSAQGQQQVSSFFSGLTPHHLLEDDIVRWDLNRVPGFKVLLEQPHGYCVLEGRGQKLHVFHANKNNLEHTLGVDLIYFNEAHRSFVLIQYKGTEKQGNTELFRFPDSQLTEELDRMDAAWNAISGKTSTSSGD